MEFLAPFSKYYYFVYWFVVMLMTVSRFNTINKYQRYAVIERAFNYQPLLLFSLFFIVFYGLRPVYSGYFGDTGVYANTYWLLKNYGVFNMQGAVDIKSDWLFYTIQKFCAEIMDVHLWLMLMTCCYLIPMLWGCWQIDKKHGALLMLFCVGAFEFYSFGTNGVRNGIACSIMILAVASLCKKKIVLAAIFCLLSIGFHKSALLSAAALFFSFYVRKPKYMFIAWLGAIGVSLAIGGQIDAMLSSMSYDERLAGNLQSNEADGMILEHRFRWDFLLYSSMPILLAWYTIFKRKLYNNTYLLLLGTYMYANSFWVLAIRAIFSNRIAYLSWFIYPIVLAYPLMNFDVFKEKHSKKTALILLAHFGFTTILWLLGK
ncbi:EpsG family protein [Xylanibacter ruminicola]|uniref:EpsG family protein n=1 Tax=Xylanibacter ruminicola TaxID=839 RepID=A0A1H4DRN4_XYLRU|nr:EpsG family protein [Xylanibacter ruminicola]SEA75178.1 EpsG family protein [Xylanibacter ruminicola]